MTNENEISNTQIPPMEGQRLREEAVRDAQNHYSKGPRLARDYFVEEALRREWYERGVPTSQNILIREFGVKDRDTMCNDQHAGWGCIRTRDHRDGYHAVYQPSGKIILAWGEDGKEFKVECRVYADDYY